MKTGANSMQTAVHSASVKSASRGRVRLTSPLIAYSAAGLASAAVWAGLIGLLLG